MCCRQIHVAGTLQVTRPWVSDHGFRKESELGLFEKQMRGMDQENALFSSMCND